MIFSAPWVTVEVGYGSTWQTEPGSITWTDETAKVLVNNRVKTTRGASAARGKVDVGTAKFSLLNTDRRFDPTHATGDLFGSLLPGTPVRLLAWPSDQLLTVDGEIVLVDGLPVTTGSSIELWSGTVPSWPQRYDKSNKFAWCPIGAYDRFDKLSRAKIPRSVLQAALLALNPVALWPMDETSGRVMRDISGNGIDGEYPVAGTTSLHTEILVEDEYRADALDLDTEHWAHAGDAALVVPDGDYTIVFAVDTTTTDQTPDYRAAFQQGTGNAGGDGVAIGITTGLAYTDSSPWYFSDRRVTGVSTGRSTTNATWGPGLVVAWRDGPAFTDLNLYVFTPSETALDVAPISPGLATVQGTWIGKDEGDVPFNENFDGPIGTVAIFDTAIDSTVAAALGSAFLDALDGQTTDQRIGWILDEIDWPTNLRNLETGRSILGPATFKPGDGALQYLRLIEDTEDGRLFISPDGSLTFHDRYYRYLETVATTSQFTFTDQDGDQGYAEFQLDLDDELLVNVARYTRRDGTEQVASDATSVATYGEAEDVRSDLLSTTDAQVRSLAEWAVATKSTPLPRVPKIRIPLHRYSAADQATVLGLDLGHRVTVNRTPQGVGAEIDLDFVVEGVSHDVGFNEWWVDLFVSPVPQDTVELFILGTSELGGTHILAH